MVWALQASQLVRTERGVRKPLLDGVSLQIKEGSLVALVGADGAGKTTLMRALVGLLKPQKGEVRFFGESLYDNLSEMQAQAGYMPQKFGLYQDLSVIENLSLYADLFNLDDPTRQERFKTLLQMTDLTRFTERLAGKLSGGMKQKLGLACALLNHPKLLFLDEPSVGVDPLSRRELWAILRENVRKEGMTVLVATTYMDEAELCDEVIVIEDGRITETDIPAGLAERAQGLTYFVKPSAGEKIRDVQAEFLDAADFVWDAVPLAGGVRVLRNAQVSESALFEKFPHRLFDSVAPILEDGYLVEHFTKGSHPDYCPNKAISEQMQHHLATDAVVTARDLKRTFGSFVAVDETSFDVYPGEIFGLLGPNGAGKTTTFKMLCGLLTVSSGRLEVAGIDVREAREEARENLGYMSQKFALYGDLSVRENMTFFAGAYGLFGSDALVRIDSLIAAFDLNAHEDTPAKSLSGGIKQRLAMAVALLHHPKLLFLDEPTSGADVPTRRQFWRWMTALATAGTTIIVTTHFMQEAQYCDRLLIQDAGKSLILGTPEEVRANSPTMDEAFIRIVENARQESGGQA